MATLLITRQVMGNIKEALIPYVKQQLRFAKISFDLYGPNRKSQNNFSKNDELKLTTTFVKKLFPNNNSNTNFSAFKENEEILLPKLSQVEMECSRPAVSKFKI